VIAAPGSTNHGVLQGGATENSNVDLTSELVNLITAQRDYQANAQTIKTQQAVDQTLINL
jgi:flagellar hook protein FlgE